MSVIFRAGTAFLFVALLTGGLPPLSPHWRAVAADLHQAEPQEKVRAAILSLLPRKG